MTRDELARCIDHTLLKPEATRVQVAALCSAAVGFGVAAVCVSPSMLPLPPGALSNGVLACTVIGFPSGAVSASVKAFEAGFAVQCGASEVDMVVNLGLVVSGDLDRVRDEIAQVRSAVPGSVLKVIIESGALTSGQVVACCRAAEQAGADFVKTSTGFHPSGGATIDAVRLMRDTVGDRLGVKASGGIRDTATALAMIAAGATRLGTSSTDAILGGMP